MKRWLLALTWILTSSAAIAEDCDPGILSEISLTEECIAGAFIGDKICIRRVTTAPCAPPKKAGVNAEI